MQSLDDRVDDGGPDSVLSGGGSSSHNHMPAPCLFFQQVAAFACIYCRGKWAALYRCELPLSPDFSHAECSNSHAQTCTDTHTHTHKLSNALSPFLSPFLSPSLLLPFPPSLFPLMWTCAIPLLRRVDAMPDQSVNLITTHPS
jgi:hypothetical protein